MEALDRLLAAGQWFVEKVAIPALLFGVGYWQARKRERKEDAATAQKVVEHADRRSDELSFQMQQEFSRRWEGIEKYWTEQNDHLRRELSECREREDRCESRERTLSERLMKMRRWAVMVVARWNSHFPNDPLDPPPENGNGL